MWCTAVGQPKRHRARQPAVRVAFDVAHPEPACEALDVLPLGTAQVFGSDERMHGREPPSVSHADMRGAGTGGVGFGGRLPFGRGGSVSARFASNWSISSSAAWIAILTARFRTSLGWPRARPPFARAANRM